MRNISIILILLSLAIISGCAQTYYNVPAENFAERVKVLGVAPIMVDTTSDIKHPQKDQLIALLAEKNRFYEPQFLRKLKSTGNFYTVALLEGTAEDTFNKLFFRREHRDDATILYNKYFWKTDELSEYIKKNKLDAVMMIVVSGLTRTAKISSSSLFTTHTGDYNYLIMSAQILDANGTVLWEYPNFRQRILAYNPMINLQYPDFSESEANISSTVNVKYKTIDGIVRALDLKRKDLLLRETNEAEIYSRQFDEMISLLKYVPEKENKNAASPSEPARQPKPVDLPAKSPETKPAAQEPSQPAPQITPEPAPVILNQVPETPVPPAASVAPAVDPVTPAATTPAPSAAFF